MVSIKATLHKLKESKLAKDSFWAVFGKGFGSGVFLIAGIIIARLIGKDLYGEYGMVKTTMFQIAAFSTLGMYSTSTKYVGEYIKRDSSYIGSLIKSCLNISTCSSGIMAIILFVFSKEIAIFLNHEQLQWPLRILSFIIVLRSLNQTQLGIMAAFKLFKKTAITNIISGLVMLVLGAVLTYFGGLFGSLSALALSQIVLAILNNIIIRRYYKYNFKEQKKKNFTSELLKFTFPVGLQGMCTPIGNWAAIAIITKMASLGQLGIYTAAAQWNAVILLIPGLLYNVVLSYLSGMVDNQKQHNQMVKRMLLINFGITIIVFLFVYILTPFITSFYGKTFVGLTPVIRILVLSTIFDCLSNVLMAALLTTRKRWQTLSISILNTVIIIAILYFLIYKNGGEKAAEYMAIATVIAHVIKFILLAVYYHFNNKSEKHEIKLHS